MKSERTLRTVLQQTAVAAVLILVGCAQEGESGASAVATLESGEVALSINADDAGAQEVLIENLSEEQVVFVLEDDQESSESSVTEIAAGASVAVPLALTQPSEVVLAGRIETLSSISSCYEVKYDAIAGRWVVIPSTCRFCSGWVHDSGGFFGSSKDVWHTIDVPAGAVLNRTYLRKRNKRGTPNVYINSSPRRGHKGDVNVKVHVGLSGGFSPERLDYNVCGEFYPDVILPLQDARQ